MRVCTCFLLLRIFGSYFIYTHAVEPNLPKDNKRSVNLALETVLEFNEKDKASDIKFLDNVQNFITKVKTVIVKNNNVNPSFRRDFKTQAVDTFTGFIQEVVNILNTFDNKTFTDFFEILDEEMRKYHYRGCKFYELTANNEIRKLIAAKLDSMRKTSASVMKVNIDAFSETLKNLNITNKTVKEFIDYINSLYRQDAKGKFQKVLTELELHGKSSPRSTTRLREIVKNGVRLIIFDHYTDLNTNVRRDVKKKMETFWKQFNKNSPSKGNAPNAEISDKISDEVKEPTSHAANAEVKKSDYKKGGSKKDGEKHDNKRKKLSKKDTKDKDEPAKVQARSSKTKHQEQSDSLSSESLEVYHQPKEETRQKRTTKLENISKKSSKNSRNKTEKIESMKPTTRNPTPKTIPNIWIEESTGRLPKAVLDKLAIKARGHHTSKATSKYAPESKKKKYNKAQKRWHAKMYEPKHDTKRMTKYRSKYDLSESREGPKKHSDENKKLKKFRSSKSFALMQHQYKKSMGPRRVESNQTDRSSPDGTKRLKFLDVLDVLKINKKSGVEIKRPRSTADAKKLASPQKTKKIKYDESRRMKVTQRTSTDLPKKQLSKKKKSLSRKFETQLVESVDHPATSSMSVEKMEIRTDKNPKYQSQQQKVNSLENQLYVIRKIKKLEKDIEEVKSKINDKAEVKRTEPKENKEKRRLSETKTGSDVTHDPKKGNTEASGTVDNQTKLILINKNVERAASERDDKADKSGNGKRNNNTESNKVERKLFKATPVPVVSKSISDSVPSQYNMQALPVISANSKTNPIIGNTYVKNLVSKYKKLMENFEKGKSKMNVNAGLGKVKNNFSDFAVIETAKTTKEVLINSVNDKDSKNMVVDKKSANFSIGIKDRENVKKIADSQKDIIEKDIYSKNIKIDDGLSNMIKTANNKKEVLNKPVSVRDFEDKNKMPETIFRSDGNLITNNFKDKAEVAKITRTENKEIVDNEIKSNVENVKLKQANANIYIDSFTTPHVDALHITGNQGKTEFTSKNIYDRNLIPNYNKLKADFEKPKTDVAVPAVQDNKVNNVQDTTEKTKRIEIAESKTAIIEKDKNSDTRQKSVRSDFQSTTVDKGPIVKENKNTEVTLNIGSITPEVKYGETGMVKHRAFDDVTVDTEATKAENMEIQSTSIPTIATEAATRAAVTENTSPRTLELLTIPALLPSAPLSLKYVTPLLI